MTHRIYVSRLAIAYLHIFLRDMTALKHLFNAIQVKKVNAYIAGPVNYQGPALILLH